MNAKSEFVMNAKNEYRISEALNLAFRFGQIDGEHHKTWVIDQMVRILADSGYEQFVKDYNNGDGPDTHKWDKGIAP